MITDYSKQFTDCNGNSCTVSWCRIKGNAPGPVLTIVAGQHGMEHVGPGLLPEFIEEMADVLMYFNDVMLCYGITEEELKEAYTEKFKRNMTRW